MHIEKLSLINFKNYKELDLDFSNRINCILGKNGSGKTNLLDAIYYLSATKSAINTVDSQNIRFKQGFFSIVASLQKKDRLFKIQCALKHGQKKIFKVNGVEYEKLKEHIGKFPVIFILPNDTDLVREGSEIRRKYFDQMISQLNSEYLDALINYNHALKQRNSLLKSFAEKQKIDKLLIEPYDQKLLQHGKFIYQTRQQFLKKLLPLFSERFQSISANQENVSLEYESDLSTENFESKFKNNLDRDLLMQRTILGVHKDDYKFKITGRQLKKFGSQGQQKSFVIALKLSHFDILRLNEHKPILLLDDIFDKLDSFRISYLLDMIKNKDFGQVFITDARADRTKEILDTNDIESKIHEIRGGQLEK